MSSDQVVKTPKEKNQHIKVFVRVRPFNATEKASKSLSVLEVPNSKEVIIKEKPSDRLTKKFTFDRVFSQTSKQLDVYKNVVNPLINEVLAGYNCTVFAYGQTGTGKTFTMEGEKSGDASLTWSNDPLSGIIPRALSHLFDELRILQAEYSVRVSFLELYNEELFDLLSPLDDSSKIRLFEDATKKGGVIIHGLEEVTVDNKHEVYTIMEKGSLKRQTASTLMNAHSSRSHTVFSITVHIKENSVGGDELLKTGKLNLVDLAGSENIGRSGAIDKRAREAGNINQSLLTLGRVITALVERAPHIPYRESKLTRLLQESLGGRTKTSIIATVSPSACSLEETLSTLDYAHRAKNIQNRPEVNQRLAKKALIKEYTEEIDRLRRDLLATRDKNGFYIAEDNYNHMLNTIDSQKREMAELLSNVKGLEECVELKEEMLQDLSASLEEYNYKLEMEKASLRDKKQELMETKSELDEKAHLVSVHVHTESQLLEQAQCLLSVADEASGDADRLHEKLDRKSHVEQQNSQVAQNFHRTINQKLGYLDHRLKEYVEGDTKDSLALKQKLVDGYTTASQLKSEDDITKTLHFQKEIVQTMETKTAEQVSCHQNIIQQLTADCQQLFNMEKNRLQQYLSDMIHLFQELHEENEFNKKLNTELKCVFSEKIEAHDEKLQEFVRSQQAALENLRSNLQQQVHGQKLHVSQLQAASKKYIQGREKTAQKVASYLGKIQQTLEDDVKESNAVLLNLDTDFAECSHISDNITQSVVSGLQPHLSRVGEVAVLSGAFTGDILTNLNTHVEKSDSHNREAEMFQTTLEERMESAGRQGEELLRKYSESCGKTLQVLSEELNCGLQTKKTMGKNLIASMETSAALQVQQMSAFSSVVQNCGNDLNNHCDYIKDWENSVSSDVRECDQLVEKYLFEELCADVPTGVTPQRREFQYPKQLIQTSPHERLLERFHSAQVMTSSSESSPTLSSSSSSSSSSRSSNDDASLSGPLTTCLLAPNSLSKCRSASASDLPSAMVTLKDTNYSEPNLANVNSNKENKRNQMCVKDVKPEKYSASKKAPKSKMHSGTSISRAILGPHN